MISGAQCSSIRDQACIIYLASLSISVRRKGFGNATLTMHANKSAVQNGPFTVVYLVAKPLIWSGAEGDLVVIETSI